MRRYLRYLLCSVLLLQSAKLYAQANHVVISQYWANVGGSGAPYNSDFVELYNPTGTDVNMSAWSIQYKSGTSAGAFNVTAFPTGSVIKAHGYFLVQLASSSTPSSTNPLPTPDVISTIQVAASSGKIALVSSSTAINIPAPPTNNPDTYPNVVDFLGYGSGADVVYEGSGAGAATTGTKCVVRKANSSSTATSMISTGTDYLNGNGYDSDDNANDFLLIANINPHNTASPIAPAVITVSPTSLNFGAQPLNVGSAAQTFTLSGLINNNATVTTTAPYAVSKDGTTFSTSVSYTPAELRATTSPLVYVQFTPTAITAASGTLTISSQNTVSNTTTVTVSLTGTGALVYYSKSTGDLSALSTYGASLDGTGTAPSDFNTSGATYQLANRATYALTADLTFGSNATLSIPTNATLDIAGNSLTLSVIAGAGTLSGSNTSSLKVVHTVAGLSFASGKEQLKTFSLDPAVSVTLTSALNISSTGTLNVAANATLNTGGLLTLKSDASGTALISALGTGATISGNVTAERYVFDKRAWRLITSAVNSTQTINASLQEGAGGTSNDPNPGYGTQIIGNGTTNGFDVAGSAASFLVYDGSSFNNAASTNSLTLNANPGYFLFSIGNRGVNPTAGTHSSTVLRSAGTVRTGTQMAPIAAAGYTLVGNPYAAPVDFSQVTKSTSVPDRFYAWDINLNTYGGYVLITNNSGSYTSVPASPSGLNNIIASGAAIMVQSDGTNTGSLTFNESSKAIAAGSGTFSNFTVLANNQHNLRVNLTNASSTLVDGVLASFASGNSNAVDGNDAPKLANFYENISLNRSGKLLAMERRDNITAKDSIFIGFSGMKTTSYNLQIDPSEFNAGGLTAWLDDAYLHTHTKLNLGNISNVAFNVNGDVTSYQNRFTIAFAPGSEPVSKLSHVGATVLAYPNPAVQKQVNLSFAGLPVGNYNLTVTDSFGHVMQRNSFSYDGAANKLLPTDYVTGVYTVNIQSPGYNQSIKVIVQ